MNVKSGSFDTHFTYTDQERDDESGLMYYGARYYHPALGRFTQPDPSIFSLNTQTLANPQLLNPYSYSLNNPLRYNDPDGKNPAETVGGWGVGIAEALGGTAIWVGDKLIHPVRSTQEAGNMVSKAGDEVFSILQNPGIAVREAGQGYGIQAKELGEWYWNASDYERGKVLGQITEKVAEGIVVGKVAGKVMGSLNKNSKANPLDGAQYGTKVLKQMQKQDDKYHSFPTSVDKLAGNGITTHITGGDGIVRQQVDLKGSINGQQGTYRWIIEPDRSISHRQFHPHT